MVLVAGAVRLDGNSTVHGDSSPNGSTAPTALALRQDEWAQAEERYGLFRPSPQDAPPQTVIDITQELDGRLPDNDLVCIACGCGDCTVGHWVRWCIVPIVAVHRLLGLRRYVGHLDEVSRLSQRALTVCSLVVFHFRRLLRQEGGFLHQTRGERHSPVWWCRRICQEVSLKRNFLCIGVSKMNGGSKLLCCQRL